MKKSFLLLICSMLYCGGGEQQPAKPSPKKESLSQIAKSVVMVIATRDFRDEEFKEPHKLFTESGIRVTIASTDTAPAKGMLGMVVQPQITLDMVVPDSFDGIVIVGGVGCQILWDDVVLHQLVQDFNNSEKAIGAICIAPVVLARAGILKDIKATCYPTVKDDITKCGAVYTGSDIEVSSNIITCSGPKAAKDFANTLLNVLRGE